LSTLEGRDPNKQPLHLITSLWGSLQIWILPIDLSHLPTDLKNPKKKRKKETKTPIPCHSSRGKKKIIASSFRADSNPDLNTQQAQLSTLHYFTCLQGAVTCCCICSKPSCTPDLFPLNLSRSFGAHPLRNCGAQCAGDSAEGRMFQPVFCSYHVHLPACLHLIGSEVLPRKPTGSCLLCRRTRFIFRPYH
jgi:hypothetical protein